MICWWSTWQQIAQQAVRYLSRPVRYEPMKSNIQILDVDSDWCGAWKAGPRSPESPPLPHFFGSAWSRHRFFYRDSDPPTSLAPPGPAIGFSTATLIQGNASGTEMLILLLYFNSSSIGFTYCYSLEHKLQYN